jgi:hypothetical protein
MLISGHDLLHSFIFTKQHVRVSMSFMSALLRNPTLRYFYIPDHPIVEHGEVTPDAL